MKIVVLLILFTGKVVNYTAQAKFTPDLVFTSRLDSLKINAKKFAEATTLKERFLADSLFTKQLVRNLKYKNSFKYGFKELENISILTAPDSSFKLFTWMLQVSETMVRQRGALQMNTKDGSLKLYPLIDKSDITEKFADTIANNLGWMGAIYYKIVLNIDNQKNKVYTLLGYVEFSIKSVRKIADILQFRNGEPIFGAQLFDFGRGSLNQSSQARYVMEYKKGTVAKLNYDESLKLIIAEHLISETNEPQKRYTYVGDGDYQGFKWKENRWVFIPKVYNQKLTDGQVPLEKPIKN
jgi:hypothetical protein